MARLVPSVGRLIVGVSGSPGSLGALRFALEMAHRTGVPLVGVLAWVPPGGDLADRRFPSPDLRRVWADAAGKRLDDAVTNACGGTPQGLDFRRIVIRGEPGPCLVEIADSSRDLLVIGTGQRGVLSRIWHGRVSRYCLAHASCPVLAVPHPGTFRELGLGAGPWPSRRRDLGPDRALRRWGAAA
jgi:nucleotide-binding universal stress UspA family protein